MAKRKFKRCCIAFPIWNSWAVSVSNNFKFAWCFICCCACPLLQRPLRYLLAGILFSAATTIGFLVCVIPGIIIALTMPVYVNRIFLGNEPILDAFSGSFQAVYRSPNGMNFVGIEILAWLLVALVSICTCGLGALVAVPVSSFYLQNAAYHKGLIS